MSACPPECLERHNGNASAIRLALSGVGVLFVALGSLYLYATSAFARSVDVDDAKAAMKEARAEIRDELKAINLKLDGLSERYARAAKTTGAP